MCRQLFVLCSPKISLWQLFVSLFDWTAAIHTHSLSFACYHTCSPYMSSAWRIQPQNYFWKMQNENVAIFHFGCTTQRECITRYAIGKLRVRDWGWYCTCDFAHRFFLQLIVNSFQFSSVILSLGFFLFIACSFILRRSFIHSNTYAYCWHWMMNNLEIASIFSTCVCVFPLFECTSKCSTSIQLVEIVIKNWFEAPFEFMEIR